MNTTQVAQLMQGTALVLALTFGAVSAEAQNKNLKSSHDSGSMGRQEHGKMAGHQGGHQGGNQGGMNDKHPNQQPPAPAPAPGGDITLGAVVTILNVTKNDEGAKPNPTGAGRLVPVKVEYRTKVSPGAKVIALEAMLKTTNTDGSMTEVKKMLEFSKTMDTIMLPMPEGVFAKEFVFTINSKCTLPNNKGVASARETKSGTFQIIPR